MNKEHCDIYFIFCFNFYVQRERQDLIYPEEYYVAQNALLVLQTPGVLLPLSISMMLVIKSQA